MTDDRDRNIATRLRAIADVLDPPAASAEPTDADVICGFDRLDFEGAGSGSPAANLVILIARPDWPELRRVLAVRGVRLSTNGRGPTDELSALAGVRDIVDTFGAGGLDTALAWLSPIAGRGAATGRRITGHDLTNAHRAVTAMAREFEPNATPFESTDSAVEPPRDVRFSQTPETPTDESGSYLIASERERVIDVRSVLIRSDPDVSPRGSTHVQP